MSVFVPSGGAASSLDTVLRQAGAVFATRNGRTAAINYGSAAGELAVCVSAVGLVDRSELGKLVIQAPPGQLRELMARLLDGCVSPGVPCSPAVHGGAAPLWTRRLRSEIRQGHDGSRIGCDPCPFITAG